MQFIIRTKFILINVLIVNLYAHQSCLYFKMIPFWETHIILVYEFPQSQL